MLTRHQTLFRNWSIRNQMVGSWRLIFTIALIHALVPHARRYTKLFYKLQYHDVTGPFLQGFNDIYFVLGWVVLLTAIRATIIASTYQLITWLNLVSGKARVRFSEQSWLLFYDGISFSLGMHILMSSSYWLDFRELWSEWPTRQMTGQLKWYYLVQLAFWLQQLLAINLEQRRKDYSQMFTHHVVTCLLMYITYAYRFTNIGNVILCIMDVVDFLLPLAKMLKYLHYESACNVAFGVFLATWVFARHVIYLSLCWSIYRDVPGVMNYGCYSGETGMSEDPDKLGAWRYMEPFFDQSSTICLDRKVKWVFLSMLLMLQVLSLVWFGMIIKVAFVMLKGGVANDTRSGDEDEDEESERVRSHGRLNRTPSARTSGASKDPGSSQSEYFQKGGGKIRIPGSRDRKDMIGRVGCNGSL